MQEELQRGGEIGRFVALELLESGLCECERIAGEEFLEECMCERGGLERGERGEAAQRGVGEGDEGERGGVETERETALQQLSRTDPAAEGRHVRREERQPALGGRRERGGRGTGVARREEGGGAAAGVWRDGRGGRAGWSAGRVGAGGERGREGTRSSSPARSRYWQERS